MKRLYTVNDLRQLGLGRDKAYQLMRSEAFPSIKIGGQYYVDEKAFEEWLKRYENKEFIL